MCLNWEDDDGMRNEIISLGLVKKKESIWDECKWSLE